MMQRSGAYATGWASGIAVGAVVFGLVQLIGPPVPSRGRVLTLLEFREYVEAGETTGRPPPHLADVTIYPASGNDQVTIGTLVRDGKPDEIVRFAAPLPFVPDAQGSRADGDAFRSQLRARFEPATDSERAAVGAWGPLGSPASIGPRRDFADLQEYLSARPSPPAFTYAWWRGRWLVGGLWFGGCTLAIGLLLPPLLIAIERDRERELARKRAFRPGLAPAPPRTATRDLDRELDAANDPDARR